MAQSTSEKSPTRLTIDFSVALRYLAFGFLLFGIKLSIIHFYGNATPYWDQWDAEAGRLYKPLLEGTLNWRNLFSFVNEHCVLMTHLLNLAELKINGIWNPLLQMVLNAALHIAVLGFIIHLLTDIVGRKHLTAFLVFSVFLFGVPYAWENTLAGIQSMFYFVLFFSTACIWLTTTSTPLTTQWWGGILCSVFGFLSLASGVFALVSAGTVSLLLYLSGARRTWSQLFAILIILTIFIAGVLLTPTISYHAPLKASSPMQFLEAFKSTLSWPEGGGYLATVIRNLPALVFTYFMLTMRPQPTDRRWVLLALIIWMTATAAAIAYGRATGSAAPRYLDLFAIFILVNFTSLISILKMGLIKNHRRAIVASGFWIIAIIISMTLSGFEKLPSQLTGKRDISLTQEAHTRNYLATGDANHLQNKPFHHIPYPNADRLISLLDNEKIRAILPSNIQPANKGRFDFLITQLLENFYVFIIAGLTLVLLLIAFNRSNFFGKSEVK